MHESYVAPAHWSSAAALIFALGLGACGSEGPPPDVADVGVPTHAQRKAAEARTRLEASDGGRLVLASIDAHGGLEAWYSAPTSAYTWEYSNVGANLRFKSRLVADNVSRRIYHHLMELGTPDEPQAFDGRFAWDGENAWISPASVTRINPRFWAATGYYFNSMPFVFADPGVHHEQLPDEELDGRPYDMVQITYGENVGDSPDDYYILYLDKTSHTLRAIRYVVTFGGRTPRGETLFYYDNAETVDGLTVATHFRGYQFRDGEIGDFRNEAWATDISFREPFVEEELEMPEDGRVVEMGG